MINVSKLTLPQIMGITLFSFFIIMGFLAMKDSMEASEGPRRFPTIGGMEPIEVQPGAVGTIATVPQLNPSIPDKPFSPSQARRFGRSRSRPY